MRWKTRLEDGSTNSSTSIARATTITNSELVRYNTRENRIRRREQRQKREKRERKESEKQERKRRAREER
jgi:hypothetical protein